MVAGARGDDRGESASPAPTSKSPGSPPTILEAVDPATGGKIAFVRTPEERFRNLPGYDFAPHYREFRGLRMHYVDEGPRDAAPVLLLHGEPTWSYLYREFIPPLVKAGHRVVVPDLIGFGKSDKPIHQEDYSYQFHVDAMSSFVRELDLREATLFCQDWGGLIGLRIVAEQPERFARVVTANTGLPGGPTTPKPSEPRPPGPNFLAWLAFSQARPDLPIDEVIQMGTKRKLEPEILAAYNAPFPSIEYKAGARIFPVLVPTQMAENREAWEVLKRFDRPWLTAFSDGDPITFGQDVIFQAHIPGAKGQPHTIIANGGHFLQEDQPGELVDVILSFMDKK